MIHFDIFSAVGKLVSPPGIDLRSFFADLARVEATQKSFIKRSPSRANLKFLVQTEMKWELGERIRAQIATENVQWTFGGSTYGRYGRYLFAFRDQNILYRKKVDVIEGVGVKK